MPSPSSAAIDARRASRAHARAGTSRPGSGGHAQQRRALAPQVRWDRLARAALLCVLAALLYLYLSAGVHMFSTWRQAHRDEASVRSLESEHGRLARQRAILVKPETVELEARRLGMIKAGEQPYLVSGLPSP